MKKIIIGLFVLLTFQSASFAQSADIVVSGEWARPILIAGRPGGAYMKIENNGSDADKLISATSSISPRVEVHEHTMTGGIMRMNEVEGGLAVPAGGSVEMKPGGYHIMLFETNKTYKPGETIDIQLKFEKAGTIEKTLEVRARK